MPLPLSLSDSSAVSVILWRGRTQLLHKMILNYGKPVRFLSSLFVLEKKNRYFPQCSSAIFA